MDFSVKELSRKIIITIVALSFLVALGCVLFFRNMDAIPYVVGVIAATLLNIAKFYWLRASAIKASEMDTASRAGFSYQVHYFLRLVLTGGVLLIAALLPDNIINLLGVALGILVFPIAMRITRFFVPKDIAKGDA